MVRSDAAPNAALALSPKIRSSTLLSQVTFAAAPVNVTSSLNVAALAKVDTPVTLRRVLVALVVTPVAAVRLVEVDEVELIVALARVVIPVTIRLVAVRLVVTPVNILASVRVVIPVSYTHLTLPTICSV